MKITKKAYNQAVQRMEELLKLTTGIEDGNNAYIKELKEVSDKVYFYEKLHYPVVEGMTVIEAIELKMFES